MCGCACVHVASFLLSRLLTELVGSLVEATGAPGRKKKALCKGLQKYNRKDIEIRRYRVLHIAMFRK